MLQSEKQALRLRRAVLSNFGVLSLLLLSLLASHFGYFTVSHTMVMCITATMWLGHCVLVLIIAMHGNLRFKDASLTLPQMVWVTLGISLLLATINDLRPLMLMGYLLVMSFGLFRLSVRGFYGFTFFILFCYLSTLFWVYQTRPDTLNFSKEFFVFIGFGFTLGGFLLMGNEFSVLRQTLNQRHRELKGAISRIEELAVTDELTGLYNRRYLMHILEQQKALANRSQYRFVVCYIDLDHFKKVNDQYGHAVGDKVLVSFASLIRSSLREVDVGARIGGEEFVLVLADTQLDDALGVCRRMADKWKKSTLDEMTGLICTFSAGVVQFEPHDTIEHTLDTADKLLYDAKKKGRNRIEYHQDDANISLDFGS